MLGGGTDPVYLTVWRLFFSPPRLYSILYYSTKQYRLVQYHASMHVQCQYLVRLHEPWHANKHKGDRYSRFQTVS